MRLLLDTHAFVWWINDDSRLSDEARNLFSDGGNELLFSVASGWEMAIKISSGKLTVTGDLVSYLSRYLAENAIEVLPISLSHAAGVAELPNYHRDPFDRLLISQALQENIALLSADPQVARYPAQIIW